MTWGAGYSMNEELAHQRVKHKFWYRSEASVEDASKFFAIDVELAIVTNSVTTAMLIGTPFRLAYNT